MCSVHTIIKANSTNKKKSNRNIFHIIWEIVCLHCPKCKLFVISRVFCSYVVCFFFLLLLNVVFNTGETTTHWIKISWEWVFIPGFTKTCFTLNKLRSFLFFTFFSHAFYVNISVARLVF